MSLIINTGGLYIYGANDRKKSLKIILISFRKQEDHTCHDDPLSTIARTWTVREFQVCVLSFLGNLNPRTRRL